MAMRLHGMADALKTQQQDPGARELSFLERLALLVDHQWNWRQNQALARRLHAAKLRGNACVEEIDYRAARGLDKSVIRALAQESAWVRNHENIFVLGPTGVGKSFVACALAQKACRDGYSALYTRAAALFRDLAMARADGSLRLLLAKLSRIDRAGDRRLGHGAAERTRAPRLLGDLRRPLSNAVHDPDLATARGPLARADRRSHRGRRHPRPPGPQRAPHRDAGRLDAEEARQEVRRSAADARRVSPVPSGERDCCPFPRTPFPLAAACLRFAPDLGSLDQAEHFLHNQKASVATLRLLFGIGPESCSASLRNAFAFAGIRNWRTATCRRQSFSTSFIRTSSTERTRSSSPKCNNDSNRLKGHL